MIRKVGLVDRVARGLYRRFVASSAISVAAEQIPRLRMRGALRQLKQLGFAPDSLPECYLGVASPPVPSRKEYKVGDRVLVSLSSGRVVGATVKAVVNAVW
jgi:hypothetical protein